MRFNKTALGADTFLIMVSSYHASLGFHRWLCLLGVAFALGCLSGTSDAFDPPAKRNPYEAANNRGIWDYRWTDAKSGLYWELPDKGVSDGKAGNKPQTPKFLQPTFQELNRHYSQVEAAELAQVQSPQTDKTLAVLVCHQAITDAGGRTIPVGVYAVALRWHNPQMPDASVPPPSMEDGKNIPSNVLSQPYLVVKQQGKLLGMLPVIGSLPYTSTRQQLKGKPAFAVLAIGAQGIEVNLVVNHTRYIAVANPAQLPVQYPSVTQPVGETMLEAPKHSPQTLDPKSFGY
ncbi:MAG: hypothetical protein QE263_04730 [Vampirovibrionales bacterium]|nr:hypothetical protein [Vampirovibrionales bacterium]